MAAGRRRRARGGDAMNLSEALSAHGWGEIIRVAEICKKLAANLSRKGFAGIGRLT